MLDLCCYTGGFAIAAAVKGASSVTAVDLDERSIELARRNAAINNIPSSAIRYLGLDNSVLRCILFQRTR